MDVDRMSSVVLIRHDNLVMLWMYAVGNSLYCETYDVESNANVTHIIYIYDVGLNVVHIFFI